MSSAHGGAEARILHVIYGVGPASGGLGPAALQLSASQREVGLRNTIWSSDAEPTIAAIRSQRGLTERELRTFETVGPGLLHYSPHMNRASRTDGAEFDVLHQHGLWTATSHLANIWRARHDRPTVVAPHGSLSTFALERSRARKWIAGRLYQDQNFAGAACLHALSQRELDDCRGFGLRNPIAILPNGISGEWIETSGSAARFRAEFGLDERRILLYLSRVTPIKGLPLLLRAMADNRQSWADWQLVIAGPDEFGHMAELKAIAEDAGISKSIVFVGSLLGQIKRDAFEAADCFVLPSLSEAAPMAVLEALGAAVPVVTTHGCSWPDLIDHGCGWWVPIGAQEIGEALRDAMNLSTSDLKLMGHNGRKLVAEKYRWEVTARRSGELYDWLRGRGERPDFVEISTSSATL